MHGWGLYKMQTTLLIGSRSFAVAMTVAKNATASGVSMAGDRVRKAAKH